MSAFKRAPQHGAPTASILGTLRATSIVETKTALPAGKRPRVQLHILGARIEANLEL